ncbi:MAG TPA: cytochrome c oxidase subunit II [Longimicrobiales bacterium]|nr:cytochrome c oxidase subunit II [Longimicrobiales bacterium]
MTQWLPPGLSSYSDEIDGLFYLILWITGIIFVIVQAALLFFAFKYRHREGRRAFHIHSNIRAEAIWTGIPFLLVLAIAALSIGPWLRLRDVNRFPPPDLEVLVTAKQFEWLVTYAGADGQLGTADDFSRRNRLDLPVGRVVHVHLEAEDVIHSFFLPEFRVKQDAVPGMRIPVWFQPEQAGEYVLGCAELCGLGHYRMKGAVTVHEAAAFDAWLQSSGATALEQRLPAGAEEQPANSIVAAGSAGHAHH